MTPNLVVPRNHRSPVCFLMYHLRRSGARALCLVLLVSGIGTSIAPAAPAQIAPTPALTASAASDPVPLTILSAYYGLHAALPIGVIGLCRAGIGKDGMPLILSHTVDSATLSPLDFAVILRDGTRHTPICATTAPAINIGEERTILLVGDLGDPVTNPPMRVEIVGSLLTNGPGLVQDFRGAHIDTVTPLGEGPSLIVAEILPPDQQRLGSTGRAAGCPTDRTVQVVRVTWAGGVTRPEGGDANDATRQAYQVTLRRADGSTVDVAPFALGDLNDNDNNHHLCLDVAGTPIRVNMRAGMLVSPGHFLNPATAIDVRPAVTGWQGLQGAPNGCSAYYAGLRDPVGAAAAWCRQGKAFRWYSTLPANQPSAHDDPLTPLSIFYTCAGDPANPGILVLHGFPTSSFDFHAVFAALSSDYYLCALDTPGYGFSDKPTGAYAYSLFDDADLIDTFVRSAFAGRAFTLLTHDKGDSVGLIYLARVLADGGYPAQITQHVILNGNLYLPLAQLSAGQKALLDPTLGPLTAAALTPAAFAIGLGTSVYSPPLTSDDPETLALTSIFAYQSGTKVLNRTIQYLNERTQHENEWLRTLADSPIPVTVIWGAQDSIAPTAVADYIWKTYLAGRGAAAAYWQIPCANHYVQHDRPEDTVAIIRAAITGSEPSFAGQDSCKPDRIAAHR